MKAQMSSDISPVAATTLDVTAGDCSFTVSSSAYQYTVQYYVTRSGHEIN